MAYPDGSLHSLAETIYESSQDDFEIKLSTYLKAIATAHSPVESACGNYHYPAEEFVLCDEYQSAHELAVTWLQCRFLGK